MPRTFKLTWQPGTADRIGRWKKVYRGRSYYFCGGKGKSDRDGYAAALAAWEEQRVKIDAETPKPHQPAFEQAIAEWEGVLIWSRKHRDAEMADEAVAKLKLLRTGLAALKPKKLRQKDTFAGRFDRAIRFPVLQESMEQVGAAIGKFCDTALADQNPADGMAESQAFSNSTGEQDVKPTSSVVDPSKLDWDVPDPLGIEHKIWRDRLEVERRSAAPPEKTLGAHVAGFLEHKKAAVTAGELSVGRVYALRLHLTHFSDWLGHETPVADISAKGLLDYRATLLEKVEHGDWSQVTAKDRLNSVKSFINWLWRIEAIETLPRIMDGKSNVLAITKPLSDIIVFTMSEITTLLTESSQRTQLYILLMLNCGMTQKDIADLSKHEVDWKAGCVTRKRSKTRKHDSVPTVRYRLWPETLRLLKQERSDNDSERVLLNESGKPLWHESVDDDGKLTKMDNVRSAFARLQKKTKINKPLKSLKKTSASLIRSHEGYASLESLFLGHAAQSMSDRHYAQAPQTLLDEAVNWLRGQYGLPISSNGSGCSS